MKTVLVTGGAGFIGSNFIRYLLGRYDYRIINLDLLTYSGNPDNLEGLEGNPNYGFIKEDIADRAAIDKVFTQNTFDYVVNFAAESHVDRSIKYPGIFIRTNVAGTQVLLDASMRQWQTGTDKEGYPDYREGVKYIQISTDEVYGALGKTGMFTEDTPLSPNSPYSASKAAADLLAGAYNKTFKLPVNITRCSNNYGPRQFPEKLIPLMIKNALEEKPLPLYGDGMHIRDWLYVEDHCRAVDIVLHKGKKGEIYNIGANNEKTNIEIARIIVNALGKPEGLITYVRDRLGHDRRYAVDSKKIMAELGWRPLYSFEESLRSTIDWYKKS